MTTQELRELDKWIDLNLFENDLPDFSPRYTTDSAFAMDVLKKCAEKGRVCIDIDPLSGLFSVFQDVRQLSIIDVGIVEQAETLELAIAQFAKSLFSQTTK